MTGQETSAVIAAWEREAGELPELRSALEHLTKRIARAESSARKLAALRDTITRLEGGEASEHRLTRRLSSNSRPNATALILAHFGTLPSGAALSGPELGEAVGLTRAPVYEALRVLMDQGKVQRTGTDKHYRYALERPSTVPPESATLIVAPTSAQTDARPPAEGAAVTLAFPPNLNPDQQALYDLLRTFPNGASGSLLIGRLKWRSQRFMAAAGALASRELAHAKEGRYQLSRRAVEAAS